MSGVFTRDDEYFMRAALAEARIAFDEGEIPIGAVIVCEGRIIARAHNEVERLLDPTAHAEVLAITSATQSLGGKFLSSGCTLYVTVEPARCVLGLSFGLVSGGSSMERRRRSLATHVMLLHSSPKPSV